MKIHAIMQRTAEWHALHRGIPTASRFDEIITATGKRSGQARRYMYELAYERITERLHERPNLAKIAHVRHGIDNESTAVGAFEALTGLSTLPIGFITDDLGTMGCSPDRVVDDRHSNAAVEVKCPTGPVHCGYLLDGVEDAYKAQLQGQILIGGFSKVHFYSWHPELPAFHAVVFPDPAFLTMLAKYLREFEAELVQGVHHIRAMGHWPSNAPSVFPEEDGPDAA